MIFSYKIKTKDGQIVEGSMEAADRFALARELRLSGSVPLSISSNRVFQNPFESFKKIFVKVSINEQISFCKNLSGMLNAGLSLFRALSVLKKQTKNLELDKILTSLSDEINSGGNLSTGLAKFPKVFSKLFVSMVRAGEESGNMAGALTEIGMNIEKSNSLTKKIKGALI